MLVSGLGLFFYRIIYVNGKLCQQHARFEHKCHECHVSWSGVSVRKCEGTCHGKLRIRGENHPKLNISCLLCHQDHLGINYNSRPLSNKRCIECHRDVNLTGNLTNKILFLIDKETRQLSKLIEENAASVMDSPECPYLHSRDDCASCHTYHIKEKELEEELEGYDMYPLELD